MTEKEIKKTARHQGANDALSGKSTREDSWFWGYGLSASIAYMDGWIQAFKKSKKKKKEKEE